MGITTGGLGLALLTEKGETVGCNSITAGEGNISPVGDALRLPYFHERGVLVTAFPRNEDAPGTFSITANGRPLISQINLRKATFSQF